MKNNIFFKVGLIIVSLLVICYGITISIEKEKEKTSQFYNIVYHTGDISIEYHDVTNLCYDKVGIYFTTCDSTTVILNGGAIEIIPLELD